MRDLQLRGVTAYRRALCTEDATGRTKRTDFAATPNVTHFVAQHPSTKVTLIGKDGKTQMPFAKIDAKALTQVADLAAALKAVSVLQAEQQELNRRITFYEGRQQKHRKSGVKD